MSDILDAIWQIISDEDGQLSIYFILIFSTVIALLVVAATPPMKVAVDGYPYGMY